MNILYDLNIHLKLDCKLIFLIPILDGTFQQMWSKPMNIPYKKYFLTILLVLGTMLSIFAESANNKNATKVYHILLSEEIAPPAGRLIKEAYKKAEESNADIILLEINTYGGRLDIADSIRSKFLYSSIPTIAFINNNAASAGALIALACDSIYMVPGASIGAATVVDGISGEQMPDKYQSYMRSMIRSTAETKGRNPDIAEAMVDERKVVEGISEEGKVLTLTSKEAVKFKMANGIVNNVDDILQILELENVVVQKHQMTTLDQVINFLLNPAVNSILLLIIIGGIYFELQAPGLGLPSIAALTAAILYFAPLMIDGTAQFWEISIFVIGIILVLLEIFVIPGFGVAGIAGIICIIAGLTLSLIGFDGWDFEFNFITGDLLIRAFFRVILIIFVALFTIFFFGPSLLQLPGFNKLVLTSNQESQQGYSTKRNELYDLIGKEGVVLHQLRPSGKIKIDDQIYEAISISHLIDQDTVVKVVDVEGYSLKVTKA